MTTRLRRDTRNAICKDLIVHGYLHRLRELQEAYARFARRVFDDVVPPAAQEKIDELPSSWFPTVTQVNVEFGSGSVQHLELSGHIRHTEFYYLLDHKRPETISRKAPEYATNGVAKAYTHDHHLTDEFNGLKARTAELAKDITEARARIMATLHSVTTVQKLIDLWPEAEPFARKHLSPSERLVPALPVMELNKLLDLPVVETENEDA